MKNDTTQIQATQWTRRGSADPAVRCDKVGASAGEARVQSKSRSGLVRPSCVLALLLLSVWITPSVTADTSGSDQWHFGGEVYLWGAGIGGTTTTGGDIDISFSDLIDNLDMAFMGAFAAKRERWTFMLDLIYLNVSADNDGVLSIPVGPVIEVSDKANVKLKGWIPTLTAQYSLIDDERGSLNLLGGLRYLSLESDIKLTIDGPLRTRTAKASESGSVWDGLVGVRGRVNLNDRWYLPYYADIGTGDNDLTWQVFGGVGYRFDRVDAVLGYRYMEWQFDDSSLFDDLNLSGPMAGVKFFF